eukprot:312364_1
MDIPYPLPFPLEVAASVSDYTTDEYDPSDDGYISEQEIRNKNKKRPRRRATTYYTSEEEEDIDLSLPLRIPKKKKKKKRSFRDMNERCDTMKYHRPPRKKQRRSDNHNTNNTNHRRKSVGDKLMNSHLFDSLSQHFPTESDIVRCADKFHCTSPPRLETITDFADLEKFHKDLQRSYQQLTFVKKQFDKCCHELSRKMEQTEEGKDVSKRRKLQASFALRQCEGSIHDINQKIVSINKKIEGLKQEQLHALQKMSSIQSVVKDHESHIYEEEQLMDELQKKQHLCGIEQSLIKRIYPIIDALEVEWHETKYNIECKQIELKSNYEQWNTATVISWFKTLAQLSFNHPKSSTTAESFFYAHLYSNHVCGKDLSVVNKVFLKYMGIAKEKDQQIVLKEIEKLKALMSDKEDTVDVVPRCVICRDGTADFVAIPCGHVCLCNNCKNKVAKNRNNEAIRCPFCGKQCDIYKTYSFLV